MPAFLLFPILAFYVILALIWTEVYYYTIWGKLVVLPPILIILWGTISFLCWFNTTNIISTIEFPVQSITSADVIVYNGDIINLNKELGRDFQDNEFVAVNVLDNTVFGLRWSEQRYNITMPTQEKVYRPGLYEQKLIRENK